MKPSIQAHQFVLTDGPSPSAPLPDGEAPPPYNTLPPGAPSSIYPQLHEEVTTSASSQLQQQQPTYLKDGWVGAGVHGDCQTNAAMGGGVAMATGYSPQHSSPFQMQSGGCGLSTSRDTKLGYMDFVPRMLKKKLLYDNEYETFG